MSIKITGLEQVQRRLKEAPSMLVSRAFAKALDRSIGVMAAEVEARTPIDTGLLAESVITDVNVGHNGGSAACGFNHAQHERTGKPMDMVALWVEFGHEMVSHDGKHIGHVPAHPFMRTAFESAGDRAIEVFGESLIENLSVMEQG